MRAGGYGLKSQLIVGAAAFALLAVIIVAAPWPPLPFGLPIAALAAFIGYGVWTGLSSGWARILDRSVHDTDRVGMYCAWRRTGKVDAVAPSFFIAIGAFPAQFVALLAVYFLALGEGICIELVPVRL